MAAPIDCLWESPDFDDHELVQFVCDRESGLRALIAVHSSHLGPAAGGTRFRHYRRSGDAVTDVLRLSRAMSYKNAMADLPLGGGKAVILAEPGRAKSADLLAAFGRAVEGLGGLYVTAEDVGMTVADMAAIAKETGYVAGLPAADGEVGGDTGPPTSYGVYLGARAAARRALGKESLKDLHIAIQGAGSVGSGLAHRAAKDGARLSIADVDAARAKKVAEATGGQVVSTEEILFMEADIVSPNALGSVLNADSIPRLRAPIVAGGANNQLATADDGRRLHQRGILFAPDYVINAGGIISVATEYLKDGGPDVLRARVERIPDRLDRIWIEAGRTGASPADVADAMARTILALPPIETAARTIVNGVDQRAVRIEP